MTIPSCLRAFQANLDGNSSFTVDPYGTPG